MTHRYTHRQTHRHRQTDTDRQTQARWRQRDLLQLSWQDLLAGRLPPGEFLWDCTPVATATGSIYNHIHVYMTMCVCIFEVSDSQSDPFAVTKRERQTNLVTKVS